MAGSRRLQLPPDLPGEVSDQFERLDRLERPGPVAREAVDPSTITFTFRGELAVAESGRWEHPMGAFMVRARCKLVTAGSTDTLLVFKRNGGVVDPLHSSGGTIGIDGYPDPGWFVVDAAAVIPAGQSLSIVFFHARRFTPDGDGLSVGVTSPGVGATDLTVRVDWGG